ncbi:hypothetical protein BDN70DRAFT_995264 [Pholiota conissans]|uniref:Heterokaryon incompatibility domain-containing protein n=1 Tax=Pholiota conissans TaxID=109636 RepID=A0A9P5YWF9_9AGAR|nr:hypothetical protein BDN70DRAFT_995264 [Pholiota conissans]
MKRSRSQMSEDLRYNRVTTRRLRPAFERLLKSRTSENNLPPSKLPKRLYEALTDHVNNVMPSRLLLLPEMKLIERSAIVDHVAFKMQHINEKLLSVMKSEVFALGKMPARTFEESADYREEDVRGDPWKAISDFLFSKFAGYAILSHRWLPTGELKYQDAFKQDWPSLDGPGFEKVKGFCDVTYRYHKITLAWIDSLCINRESSAELSEAVQSMYRWYQDSSVCITYLRDTTSLGEMDSDEWFRRGWTLQELIAPKRMQFYNREWIHLISDTGMDSNDKANPVTQRIVTRRTGIEVEELVSFDPLRGSDVPTRMRWAASRTTTRPEDRAYSLMGIFGVNFSISYGEGSERAFFRLILSIITSRDTPIVAQVLHWAGKAISEAIHTSRIIPSSPECYLNQISRTTEIFQREPIMLTNIGLRIKLLLVQAEGVHIRGRLKHEKHASFVPRVKVSFSPQFPFECPVILLERRFPEIPTTETFLHFFNPEKHDGRCSAAFFFGTYTFKEEGDYVYLPLSAGAFLLVIPNPYTLKRISSEDFGPTSKVDTERPIELRRNLGKCSEEKRERIRKAGFQKLKKEFLWKKNMKVIDTYL